MKLLGATECDKTQECLDTNTPLAFIDEGKVTLQVGIGNNPESQDPEWLTINDRLILDWQAYAGRYSDKTVQPHLVSILDFEKFLDGVHFRKVMPKQVGEYRDHLVRLLALPKEQGGLSNSTVRHRVSHLKSFFEWVRGQDGYKRLSSNIPAYLVRLSELLIQPVNRALAHFGRCCASWKLPLLWIEFSARLPLAGRGADGDDSIQIHGCAEGAHHKARRRMNTIAKLMGLCCSLSILRCEIKQAP